MISVENGDAPVQAWLDCGWAEVLPGFEAAAANMTFSDAECSGFVRLTPAGLAAINAYVAELEKTLGIVPQSPSAERTT